MKKISPFCLALAASVMMAAGAVRAAPVSGQFQAVDGESGGRIIVGDMAPLAAPEQAMAALLRKVHGEWGARPQIVQILSNPSAHALTFIIAGMRQGEAVAGIGFATAIPGQRASASVVYDTVRRFASDAHDLLHQLSGGTDANARPGGVPKPVAPAEPLMRHDFPDGTGSIGVPADWRLTAANGGSAIALGPTDELVAYDMVMNAMDPNNPTARNYFYSLPPQTRQYTLKTNVMLSPIYDPGQAWSALYNRRAAQNGTPAPVFDITTETRGQISNTAEISGNAAIPQRGGFDQGKFWAFVQIMPPNTMGQWSMISTWLFVPDKSFSASARTTAAVLSSVRINFGAVAAQSAAIRNMFQQKFETMIRSAQEEDAAREAQTQRFLANDAVQQDNMHKQAVAMENFALDRTVIQNDATGAHIMVSSDFDEGWLRENPQYHVVPPSGLINGIDY